MRTIVRRRQGGMTLLEVLVALVITVIGLLGLIGLQMRSYQIETESYQRSQALVLLEDMAQRIQSNRVNAAAYVASDIGTGVEEDCGVPAASATYDLCQWGNLLRGVSETNSGSRIGAMRDARGCITNPAPNEYVIAVVWAGNVESGPPGTACGTGEYTDENLRRGVTLVVRIGDLSA